MVPFFYNRQVNLLLSKNRTKTKKPLKQMNNNNINKGKIYWTYNIVYLPIKVKVLEIDEESKKARIEQGWIDFNRLYNNKEECPQR
jgi:hypothetical protein